MTDMLMATQNFAIPLSNNAGKNKSKKIVVLSYVCIIASSVQRSVSETLDENLGENCYNHLSVKIIREVAHVH